jgi:flagellar biosynthesis/type III secretory pathway protein FliH
MQQTDIVPALKLTRAIIELIREKRIDEIKSIRDSSNTVTDGSDLNEARTSGWRQGMNKAMEVGDLGLADLTAEELCDVIASMDTDE